MVKRALIGSSVEMVVRICVGVTRSPGATRDAPAMPLMGAEMRVKARSRRARSRTASKGVHLGFGSTVGHYRSFQFLETDSVGLDQFTVALFFPFGADLLSESVFHIGLSLEDGVGKGWGSISKRSWPFSTAEPFL